MRKISIVTALMVCGFLVGINEWRNIDGLRIRLSTLSQASRWRACHRKERRTMIASMDGPRSKRCLISHSNCSSIRFRCKRHLTSLLSTTGLPLFSTHEFGGEIDLEDPISLSFESETILLKTALHDLILSPRDLAYRVREGYLMITTYDEYIEFGHEIAVYDCRDLISKQEKWGLQATATGPATRKAISKL